MKEDKRKNGVSDADAKIIAALIGAVSGIVVALIGVGVFPMPKPDVSALQHENAELQAQLAQTIPAPTNSDLWAEGETQHRYWLCRGYYDWNDAEKFCETLGGHLATINSLEEQAHILSYVKENGPRNDCFWIGAQWNNGNWNQWVNGEQLGSYKNWNKSFQTAEAYYYPAFSNYNGLDSYTDSGGELRLLEKELLQGDWLLIHVNDIDVLNPDGWMICEWDYE